MFRDITTLIEDQAGFKQTVDQMVAPLLELDITRVAGIDARGFILGGAVAHQLATGFVAIRKEGKLPHTTLGVEYELEYGTDTLEIHTDSVKAGDRIFLIDDLIATGGTACAAIELIRQSGGTVVGASFVIDLPALGGRQKLEKMDVPVRTLMQFDGE